LHSITQIKNGELLRTNTYSTAAAWLACSWIDVNKVVQTIGCTNSRVVMVFKLLFSFQRLTLAHSFKDKSDRLDDVNAGLLVTMLMAADILMLSWFL
jgi:tryptophanyl-tRNA synthetase